MRWYDEVAPAFIANVANKYVQKNPLDAFSIFPSIKTKALTGYLAKYTKDDWLKIGEIKDYKRVGSMESIGDDYQVTRQPYTVEEFAFHKDVSKDDRSEYDNPFDPINDGTEFVVNRLNRVILKNLLAAYLTTGVWATDTNVSSTSRWDYLSSGAYVNDPVDVVLGWKQAIQKTTGFSPNKAIITPDVYKVLKSNTYITKRMKTTSDQIVNLNLLATLFDLDTIKVLDAVNETGTDFMLSKVFFLCYTPDRPTKFAPSAGYHMTYTPGAQGDIITTDKIPMRHLNDSVRIEGSIKTCPLVVASDLGYYAYNVVG